MNTSMTKPLQHIPTNIITGFLGVGKTTAISHLLKSKPQHERWAVLVNEFGEIGIDGSLLQGQHSESEQVFVAEVPGGCMCCVMGMPTKITLNKLLQQAKPDRLLIEPTGLGHPQEVLDLLTSEHYKQVLDVRSTLTLVDARVIADQRYREHAIFNQQLEVADLIVANKSDCYDTKDLERLRAYLTELRAEKACPVEAVEQGKIKLEWLDECSRQPRSADESHEQHGHSHTHLRADEGKEETQLPPEGYIEIRNHKGDYFSCGWRFNEAWHFNLERLTQALSQLQCERMKAVFSTELGAKGFSLSCGELTVESLQQPQGNRIELIDRDKSAFEEILPSLLAARSAAPD